MSENTMRRLRAANPIEPDTAVDAALFDQIVALPGDRRPDAPIHSKRRLRPRLAIAALAALILCSAAWAATGFRFDVLDQGTAVSTPPTALRAAFMHAYQVDADSIATIGTFTTGSEEVTVNAARAANGNGFVTQYVDNAGEVITYMGEFLSPTEAAEAEIGKRLVISSNSLNGMFEGVWQLWGLTPANTARLELRFEDGTVANVPLHDGLFVYLVGGTRCQLGRGPVSFVAIDNSGATIDEARAPAIAC